MQNKKYDEAAQRLLEITDTNRIKLMVEQFKKDGKMNEVAQTAFILWERGGYKIVLEEFGFSSNDQINSFAIGGKGKGSWIYSGEIVNGKKHGEGKMMWTNGARYQGGFKNDKREGQGIMVHSNGGTYEGSWENDMKKGKGRFIYFEKA